MISAQQWFEGATNFGPKFNLTGDGPLHHLARDPGVQEQRIRNLNRLTHALKVAKRYQLSRAATYAAYIIDYRPGRRNAGLNATPKRGHEFYSGCTRPKLYDWAGRGFIRSVSIREPGSIKGVRLFHLASILAFIEEFETAAKSERNATLKRT